MGKPKSKRNLVMYKYNKKTTGETEHASYYRRL